MDKLFPLALYGLPLIGIAYVLSKLLVKHVGYLKTPEATTFLNSKMTFKIVFLSFGILYALFCFIGIAFFLFKPPWFRPPAWLIISFIVMIVPYLGCVFGFIGLGRMGHSGSSPGKTVISAYSDIKGQKEKKHNERLE